MVRMALYLDGVDEYKGEYIGLQMQLQSTKYDMYNTWPANLKVKVQWIGTGQAETIEYVNNEVTVEDPPDPGQDTNVWVTKQFARVAM